MEMADPLGIPMDRMGSGTTWIPDAAPLPARHWMARDWALMLHGFAFVQEDKQGGPRGGSQLGSLNWGMFMASHSLAGGRFQARTMLSLDAAGVSNRGYPLLLQSGETYQSAPIHDRQHPHDFFMELGALYERPVTRGIGISIYAAPSGEPALGPVAFMHRPSAMDVPIAPLGHHWQDATHISFGVLTAGVFAHDWRLEASAFNGREPDESRWDIDPLRLDSYSGRISITPSENWCFAGGYGFINSPEALHPQVSIHRLTASVLYGAKIGSGQLASTLLWGANKPTNADLTHSILAETEAMLGKSNTLIGRAEWMQKSAEDLALDLSGSGFTSNERFSVATLSAGYIRDFAQGRGATIGAGVIGTTNFVPTAIERQYGSRTPLGAMVFVRVHPLHSAEPTAPMGGMKMDHAMSMEARRHE
jgi:hypothetical protein